MGHTCSTEQVLKILPSYSVRKLPVESQFRWLHRRRQREKRLETNVGDVDLTTTTAGATSHGTTESTAKSAARSSFESAATSRWRSRKSGFGFAILSSHVSRDRKQFQSKDGIYFSNIDESTHEALVAKRVDGLLSLLPRSIFHNSARKSV